MSDDTVELRNDGNNRREGLEGIDFPETDQAFGKEVEFFYTNEAENKGCKPYGACKPKTESSREDDQ